MKDDNDRPRFSSRDIEWAMNDAGIADVKLTEQEGVYRLEPTDEKGTLVVGPWDEPDTAYQRALSRVLDWFAEARVNYFPGAFFEIHLLGGVLKLRENGDLILNIQPLTRGFGKLFDWVWKAGLP